jgi:hypothetical protein
MFSAVVYTAGRTGSHLIVNNLTNYFKVPARNYYDNNYINGVVHCHNPLYIPPTDDFTCIVSKRKNKISAIFASQTAEFTHYSDKIIEPFKISIDNFKSSYIHYESVYKLIDISYYNNIIEIYYEDLINDPLHLFSKLNINWSIKYLTEKSPYNYYKLIENIDELKFCYDTLELTEISIDDINSVKASIEEDLNDIRLNYNGNRPYN